MYVGDLWASATAALELYRSFGLGAVVARSSHRLAGVPSEITAPVPGSNGRVFLRLGTSDLVTYISILRDAQYDFPVPAQPSVIVDAGANIGLASIWFARKCPNSRIFAIEPEPDNFAMLERNVGTYSSIVPIRAALWNREGTVNIKPDPSCAKYHRWAWMTHEGPGESVRAVTIPSLMSEHGLDHIDILKVDIEGAEKEVFESCDWISRISVLMIETHDSFRPGCSAAVNSVCCAAQRIQRGEITTYSLIR